MAAKKQNQRKTLPGQSKRLKTRLKRTIGNRKYQLAFFGILIIFVFTVGGIITRWQSTAQRSASGANEVVLTWSGGKITESDLRVMQAGHIYAVRFLDALVDRAYQGGGTPKAPGVSRSPQNPSGDPGIPRAQGDEALVRTMLLADRAARMGVTVSDDTILEFLDKVSDDSVSRGDYPRILRDATNNSVAREQLFAQLRLELQAQQLRVFAASGMFTMPPDFPSTPLSAWDYYNRMNRRVTLEALPVNVEDFVDQVEASPSESEIKELYEDGKERYPDPASPEPGFKRRMEARFQYLKADYNDILENEMAAITEEAIKEYYEENKEDFKKPELLPEEDEEPAAETEEAEEPAAETESSTDAPATEEMPEKSATEESPSEPTAEEPVAEPESTEPAAEAPAAPAEEETPAESPAEESPATEENSGLQRQNDTFFVSLTQEEPETEAPPEPNAEAPTEPAAEAPAEPVAETPAETSDEEPAPEAPTEAADDTSAQPEGDGEASSEEAVPPTYKPLEEVEEQIRRTLAREPAKVAMDKSLENLELAKRDVNEYAKQFRQWEAEILDEEPTAIVLEELAEKYGLMYGETDLLDEIEIRDQELGQANHWVNDQRQMQPRPMPVPFTALAYREGKPLFKPERIPDPELMPEQFKEIRYVLMDKEYLYWKVEEVEANVPELKDVRDEVVDAWKMQRALELAKQEAAKLAEKITDGKTLKDVIDEKQADSIVETSEFSWLTQGATPMSFEPPSISMVFGIDSPGPEFMESVFALKDGNSASVAVNTPETVVYVVRITGENPDEETRREQFIVAGVGMDAYYMAVMDGQQQLFDWFKQLEEEYDVDWVRTPTAEPDMM